MKPVYALIPVLMFVCGFTARASIQMDPVGYGEYGALILAITGEEVFDLYMQCPWPDGAITAGGDDVWVWDLGITPQKNHLFQVMGLSGAPILVDSPSDGRSPIIVEVFDDSMAQVGVYSNTLDAWFRANAGGPYSIAPGQSVLLDSSQSYIVEHGWTGAGSPQYPYDVIETIWEIDGHPVEPLVSYDYLVNTLGLSYGVHTLRMDISAQSEWYDYHETAFSTVNIVPEPTVLVLFSAGLVIMRKRLICAV